MLVGHLFSNVDLSQRGAQDRAGAAHHAPAAASLCTGRSAPGRLFPEARSAPSTIPTCLICAVLSLRRRRPLLHAHHAGHVLLGVDANLPRRAGHRPARGARSPGSLRTPRISARSCVFFARARDAPNDVSLPRPLNLRGTVLCARRAPPSGRRCRTSSRAPPPRRCCRRPPPPPLAPPATASSASRPPPPSSPSSSRSSPSPLSSPSRTS